MLSDFLWLKSPCTLTRNIRMGPTRLNVLSETRRGLVVLTLITRPETDLIGIDFLCNMLTYANTEVRAPQTTQDTVLNKSDHLI